MRWHKEGIHDSEDDDIMSHPTDAEAWHALDHFDPEFVRDPRSVRLDLSTDGFQSYSFNSIAYSCWPVFMIPYNLPPNKCLIELTEQAVVAPLRGGRSRPQDPDAGTMHSYSLCISFSY
jgi:hypothetical protein